MTRSDFIKDHGAEWRKLAGKPIFAALMQLIDAESPAKKPPATDGDRLHGASVFLNEIYGWEKLRAMISTLADITPPAFDPPITFSEQERM